MPNQSLALNPSSLRHSIQVQQLATVRNDWEDAVSQWVVVCDARASISELGGLGEKEVVADGELSGYTTHLITMRWRPDVHITPGMRIDAKSQLFRVAFVQNVLEQDRVWRLFCVDLQED